MTNYELRLTVQPLSEELEDAVVEATDAMVTMHGSDVMLMIDADGPNAVAAAQAVIIQLEEMGVSVIRLSEDLVTRSTIADRIRVSPQAVGQWIKGERKDTTPFPKPFNGVAGGVWLWADVSIWLRQLSRGDSYEHPDGQVYDLVNGWLASRRMAKTGPHGSWWGVATLRPTMSTGKSVRPAVQVRHAPQHFHLAS